MRRLLFSLPLLLLTLFTLAQTPLADNGQLRLVGNQLSNECGFAVQLRGMSTHGPMWYQNCYSQASVAAMANDWGADVIRLAMYTQPSTNDGYLSNPTLWDNWIDQMVGYAKNNGMYCIIDWHILKDGNPHTYKAQAKTFFAKMAAKYKNESHVLYEICNEPNGSGSDWSNIKSYAEEVIPEIRAHDSEAIIIVGTPEWSGKPWDVGNNKLTGSNAYNVMYTFHFYSGSHFTHDELKNALGSLPIFATEWGTSSASGNGGYNSGNADTWLSILNGNNSGGQKVSWCNWSFADKDEVSAGLAPGACGQQNWTNTSTSGTYVRNKMNTADNFQVCTDQSDSDGDGVNDVVDDCPNTPNGAQVDANGCPTSLGDADNDGVDDAIDICPGTAANVNVNAWGCEVLQDFERNVCYGYNNHQGYFRDDFKEVPYANVYYWNSPADGNAVYSAVVNTSTDQMEIEVTAGDPDYATMGMSFGEDVNKDPITLDIRKNAKLEMEVYVEKTGTYSETSVLIDFQIEDINGNQLSTDALQNLFRIEVPLNTWTTIKADFEGGFLESYDAGVCGASPTPCYADEFDFSQLKQVMFWVNPGAGATWSKPEFTGTVKIDHFSMGYDSETALTCSNGIDDADGDGVADADDDCPGTAVGATVDANGCVVVVLDADGDGVVDADDKCANTPSGTEVDADGCEIVVLPTEYHAAIDDFDAVDEVTVGTNGEYGIYWWAGQGGVYSFTRSTTGMKVAMTDGDVEYSTFGVGFGEGKYLNLDEHKNADIKLELTNNTDADIHLTVQLEDASGNKAEIIIEDASGISWENKWEKIGVEMTQGQTENYTLNLSADPSRLGGFQANSWGCSTPLECPVTEYTLDASKIVSVIFTVNGGAGTDGNPDLDPATGDLVFNYFSIGEIVGSETNILEDGATAIGFDELHEASLINLYPVPAERFVILSQDDKVYDKAVFTDIRGKVVFERELSSSNEQVSLEGLQKGIYLVKLQGRNHSELKRLSVK